MACEGTLYGNLYTLIGDCLDGIKLADSELYYELILLRYEFFIANFCSKKFTQWCKASESMIVAEDIKLFPKSYGDIVHKLQKYLSHKTKGKIWAFLGNTLNDRFCPACTTCKGLK